MSEERKPKKRGPKPIDPELKAEVTISMRITKLQRDALEQLAREVARTTKPGGVGLHEFPAKWVFTEPHILAPLVHWLPKGRLRRAAIKLALRAGRAAPYFSEWTLTERTQIFVMVISVWMPRMVA